jgi:hypothetical protein
MPHRSTIASLIFLVTSTLACAQQFDMRYDSRGHPKAKGVWVAVKYPSGWKAQEGERPNIVQKFSGDYNGLYTVLSLQVLNAGGPVENECRGMRANEFAGVASDATNKVYASNAKKITHEQKPAFLYEMTSTIDRAGMTMTAQHKVMTICYKNTMISAWCSPSRFDKANKTLLTSAVELNEASSLCHQFFNSVVLMDNY